MIHPNNYSSNGSLWRRHLNAAFDSLMSQQIACITLLLMGLLIHTIAWAENTHSTDPLNSPQWETMREAYLKGGKVVFDDTIKVFSPPSAEDSLNVPVSFRADALKDKDIEEIIVIADLNPIPLVLRFYPEKIEPYLAFRFKVQQSTPIRVAAKTADQVWHVGSVWVDAAGGGCTMPSVGTSTGDWTRTLGQVAANLWRKETANRLRVRVMHPMDTGLANGIPRFHIEELKLIGRQGERLAWIQMYEPISENPMLSFDVGKYEQVSLSGRDNNGNLISAQVR